MVPPWLKITLGIAGLVLFGVLLPRLPVPDSGAPEVRLAAIMRQTVGGRLLWVKLSDRRVLIEFQPTHFSRADVELDLKFLVQDVLRSGLDWEKATITAAMELQDDSGIVGIRRVYAATVSRESAEQVRNWLSVTGPGIWHVDYIHPKLR